MKKMILAALAACKSENGSGRNDPPVEGRTRKEHGHKTVKQEPCRAGGRCRQRERTIRQPVDKEHQKDVGTHLRRKIDRRKKPEPRERKTVKTCKRYE